METRKNVSIAIHIYKKIYDIFPLGKSMAKKVNFFLNIYRENAVEIDPLWEEMKLNPVQRGKGRQGIGLRLSPQLLSFIESDERFLFDTFSGKVEAMISLAISYNELKDKE